MYRVSSYLVFAHNGGDGRKWEVRGGSLNEERNSIFARRRECRNVTEEVFPFGLATVWEQAEDLEKLRWLQQYLAVIKEIVWPTGIYNFIENYRMYIYMIVCKIKCANGLHIKMVIAATLSMGTHENLKLLKRDIIIEDLRKVLNKDEIN